MSFCSKCGSEIKKGSFYCGTCGNFAGERIEKVSPVITTDAFCNSCGQKINHQYCSKCGQPAVHMNIRKGIMSTDSIKSNIGQVAQNIKIPKKEEILNKEAYQAKFEEFKKRYDWKKLLTNSVVFVVVLNLFGILLGVLAEAFISSGLKDENLTMTEIRGIKDFLQLKGNLLGMLYGMALRLNLSVKASYLVGVNTSFRIALPWILLLFLLLFVIIANGVSKAVVKEEKSMPAIVVNSLVNGVFVTLLLCVLLHKQNVTDNVMLRRYADYYSGAKITIKHSGIGISSFFYVSIVTFLAQMILPSVKFMNEKAQNAFKMTKKIFNVLLVISLVGGVGLMIGLAKCNWTGGSILTYPILIGAGVGAFMTMITSGGFSLASVAFQGELSEVKLGLFQLKLHSNGSIGVYSPFAIMQILLLVIFFLFLVLTAMKYWKEHKSTTMNAIIEGISMSAFLSLLVTFVSKLCSLGGATENGVLSISGNVAVYVGNSVGFGFFIKRFLYFAIVLIGAYFLVVYCEKACEKVLAIKISNLAGLTIALSCAVILIRSVTFSANSFEKTVEDINKLDYSQVGGVLNIGNEIENYFDTFSELFEFDDGFYY